MDVLNFKSLFGFDAILPGHHFRFQLANLEAETKRFFVNVCVVISGDDHHGVAVNNPPAVGGWVGGGVDAIVGGGVPGWPVGCGPIVGCESIVGGSMYT